MNYKQNIEHIHGYHIKKWIWHNFTYIWKKQREVEYKESKHSVTYGLLSSINDQDCDSILFCLQYLPDMINWLTFAHSGLDGRLREKDFELRDKNNLQLYRYNVEMII